MITLGLVLATLKRYGKRDLTHLTILDLSLGKARKGKLRDCGDVIVYEEPGFQNRPFPSSLVPVFRNESKCETFHMKMSSACSFIFLQIKVIFIRMVLHLDSL